MDAAPGVATVTDGGTAATAQRLQGIEAELGQLVEEEDAVVGKAHLHRTGDAAAADEASLGDGVMGGAEGTSGEKDGALGEGQVME